MSLIDGHKNKNKNKKNNKNEQNNRNEKKYMFFFFANNLKEIYVTYFIVPFQIC